jgi:hypothetical protein
VWLVLLCLYTTSRRALMQMTEAQRHCQWHPPPPQTLPAHNPGQTRVPAAQCLTQAGPIPMRRGRPIGLVSVKPRTRPPTDVTDIASRRTPTRVHGQEEVSVRVNTSCTWKQKVAHCRVGRGAVGDETSTLCGDGRVTIGQCLGREREQEDCLAPSARVTIEQYARARRGRSLKRFGRVHNFGWGLVAFVTEPNLRVVVAREQCCAAARGRRGRGARQRRTSSCDSPAATCVLSSRQHTEKHGRDRSGRACRCAAGTGTSQRCVDPGAS